MKECAYCGRKHEDQATRCSGCGASEFKSDAPPESDERSNPEEELVILKRCERLADADLVVSRLATAGIEALLPDEFLSQAVGFNLNTYGYVRVLVRRRDYESARAMVAEPAEAPKPQNSPAPQEVTDAQPRKACVACGASIPENSRLCPKCGWTQPDCE